VIRSIKSTLFIAPVLLAVWASFACGQLLRRSTAPAVETRVRLSSLPDSGAGMGDIVGVTQQGDDPAHTFNEVLDYVRKEYVDHVEDEKKLGFGAVKTMLLSLDDPKTRFLDPTQRKQLLDQLNGEFPGIGAVIAVVKQKKGPIDERRLALVAPVPGGPADKAGLRPGDVVTEIDGHWIIAYDPRLDLDQLHVNNSDDPEYRKAFKVAVKKLTDGVTLPKALEQLTAKDGKTIALTIERPGEAAPIKATLTTATTKLEPVEYKALNGGVGYLRVTQFNDHATEAFTAALANAREKSLIVDLRNNAGGPVTGKDNGAYGSALALLSRLSSGGQIGTLVRAGNKQEPINLPGGAAKSYKISVLVNGGTANLAELVASSLKEKSGAKIVGSNTFGDSVYQKLVELQKGSGMTITAGKILTAHGVDFTSKGLQPDVAVTGGGPQSSDAVVERALSVLEKA
jgi:carboxyl-terminal processing protease